MAESPARDNALETQPKTIGRPFVKGGPPGPGRPKLPDWLADRSEKALLYIADVADGTEFAEPELRLKAAQIIVDRFYGKPKEQVEHTGEVEHVTRVELAIVRTVSAPKTIATSKTLTLDAE